MNNIYYRYLDKSKLPTLKKPNLKNIKLNECTTKESDEDTKGSSVMIQFVKDRETQYHNPIIDFIETLGDVTVDFVQYLITEPNSLMRIHNDTNRKDCNATSLNYSFGSPKSYLAFYDAIKSKDKFLYNLEQKNLSGDWKFEGIKENNSKIVTKTIHDTSYPILCNCAKYHRAVNKSSERRYVVHFRLKKKSNGTDISFSNAEQLFRNYIINV